MTAPSRWIVFLLVALPATVSTIAQDSTPQSIKVQGFLSEKPATGPPIPATGSYLMTFDLYDHSDPTQGTLLASAGPHFVDVLEGIYDVELSFPASAFDGVERWVQITVQDAGGGGSETLEPLVPLVSVPFAYVADQLDGFEGADLEESEEITTALVEHEMSVDPHSAYVKKTGDTVSGPLTVDGSFTANDLIHAPSGIQFSDGFIQQTAPRIGILRSPEIDVPANSSLDRVLQCFDSGYVAGGGFEQPQSECFFGMIVQNSYPDTLHSWKFSVFNTLSITCKIKFHITCLRRLPLSSNGAAAEGRAQEVVE